MEPFICVSLTCIVGRKRWSGQAAVLYARLGRTPLTNYIGAIAQAAVETLGKQAGLVAGSEVKFHQLSAHTGYVKYCQPGSRSARLCEVADRTSAFCVWDWEQEPEETFDLSAGNVFGGDE